MAHPLTQHPPSALPFGSATRPSPLAFSFGYNSTPSPSHFGYTGGNSPLSFGIGTKTPLRPASINHGFAAISTSTSTPASLSLKRTRKSPSPTLSSSSPTSSPRAAFRKVSLKGKEREDASMEDGSPKRTIKKLRKDTVKGGGDELDVGVLLATLPPNAHLQVLLSLLKDDPSLRAGILAHLPQPDLPDCLRELSKAFENVKKVYGYNYRASGPDQARAWGRAQAELSAFCKIATTYLVFLRIPPSPGPNPHHSTSHSFLASLTKHIIHLLPFVPTSPESAPPPDHPLLELAKTVISHWNAWLSRLCENVNSRGEIFPLSIASGWIDALDELILATTPHQAASFSGWGNAAAVDDHPLLTAFREALEPIRDRFVDELGWMIGRRRA